VRIVDPAHDRYEVPASVLPFPKITAGVSPAAASIRFEHTAHPFSFSILRAGTNEVLFSTAAHPLVFEPQFLRLAGDLPVPHANLYGLGEHTDPFRLPTRNYTRTLWSRDAYGVPNNTNLYSNHPVYFEHRASGTHAVFVRNSNGMMVRIDDQVVRGQTTVEFNALGGVLDVYFLAGSTSDPAEVARQYAALVGAPAEVPYWSFGLHQCRFGYQSACGGGASLAVCS
jgi:alpha-glucosidase